MKRIYLIDCPGVVPPSKNDSPEDILLRGVVRVENVENPEQYIAAVLKKTKPHHIERTYDVRGFSTPTKFLELLAMKGGRLLKGGEADVDGVAKMVLNDFLRGKIPWFTPPPVVEGEEKGIDGRRGALGEMGRANILENAESSTQGDTSMMESPDTAGAADDGAAGGDNFQGFDGSEDEGDPTDSSDDDSISGEGSESNAEAESLAQDAPG